MTYVRMTSGSSTMFGPGNRAYTMPITVSSAADGRPVLPANHRTTTITATAPKTNSRVSSALTGSSFPSTASGNANGRALASPATGNGSVAVVLGLVRPVHVHAQVLGLLLA